MRILDLLRDDEELRETLLQLIRDKSAAERELAAWRARRK